MENLFLMTLIFIGSLFIISVIIIYSIGKIEEKLEDKVNQFMVKKIEELEKKENILSEKVEKIKSWQKYITFSIGDPVLITLDLVNTKGDEPKIEYRAFVEARITDLSQTQAKLELIDFTTSVKNPRITRNGMVNFLQQYPWQPLHQIERILNIEERREMQLNKLIN